MADIKISQLPAATSPQAGDVAPMVSGGITVKTTSTQLVTAALNATPVTVAQGGTGGTTQATARTGLGLGTMSTQNANAVSITGGSIGGVALTSSSFSGTITNSTIDSSAIGSTTPSTGAFSNLSYTGTFTGGTGILNIGSGQIYKDADGNVGINTILPGSVGAPGATSLTIDNAVNGSILNLRFNGAQALTLVASSSASAVAASNVLSFVTNNTPKFQIDSAGAWLIGTSAGTAGQVFSSNGSGAAASWLTLGTMASQNANNVSITGGAIDGTTIGATTASTGAFTVLSASSKLVTDTIQPNTTAGLLLQSAASTTIASFGAGSSTNVSITPTNGNVTIAPTGVSVVTISAPTAGSGTMNNIVIGGTTPVAGTFSTLTANTSVTTPIVATTETGGISFNDSTGATAVTLASSATNSSTFNKNVSMSGNNSTVTISPTGTGSVVINPAGGGSINNVVIGNTTAAAATFTTVQTNSQTSTTPVLSYNGANTVAAFGSTASGTYNQLIVQNKSGTIGASSNIIVSNDLSTDSSYYVDLGINSSVYSDSPADFNSLNNGAYLVNRSGPLSIGARDGNFTYLTYGNNSANAHVINNNGAIGLTTDLTGSTGYGTSGQVLTSQGAGAPPIWTSTTPGSGTVTSVSGTGTVSGITLTGTVTTSGSLTLGGTLDLSSPPAIGETTPSTGAFTTLSGSTSVTSPIFKATSSAGGTLQSNNGTACLQWGAGGGSNVIFDGGVSLTAANVTATFSPTGTGTVTIAPATAGSINNMVIGGTTAAAGTFTNLAASGNFNLTGSSARITGDFDSATYADRTAFQSNTSNANTDVWAAPTGSGVTSSFSVINASDFTNHNRAAFGINDTSISISSIAEGSVATYLPIVINVNGNQASFESNGTTFNTNVDIKSTLTLNGVSGTAGQVLTSNGSGSAPTWTTVSSGSGTVTSVGGTGTVSGITLTGTVTTSGNLTLGGALDLSAPPAIGGTTPNTGKFTTVTANGATTIASTTAGGGSLVITPNNGAGVVTMVPSTVGGGDGALIVDVGDGTVSSWTFGGGDLFPSQGATNMTNGFVYIPAAAGAPTGSPTTTNGGIAAMYFDETNDKLYIYNRSTTTWVAIN